jgi:hypothetical protein
VRAQRASLTPQPKRTESLAQVAELEPTESLRPPRGSGDIKANVRENRFKVQKPTKQPRITGLDPEETALSFVRAVAEHCVEQLELLGSSLAGELTEKEDLRATPLYRRVRKLVDYAILGVRPAGKLRDLLAPLERYARSPLWDRVDLAEVAACVDPQSGRDAPIKVVLAAAFVRERLALGEAVTTTDLAVLAGLSRTAVMTAIRDGSLRLQREATVGSRKASEIAARDAMSWLKAREVAGFGTTPPRTARGTRPA